MDRINTYNLFKFIRTIFLLQLFVLSLVVGISMNMRNDLNLTHLPKIALSYPSLSQVKVDSNNATNLWKNVNIVMAGKVSEAMTANSYFDNYAKNLLTANIRVLAQVPEGAPSFLPVSPEEIVLPAIKKEEQLAPEAIADVNKYLVRLYCTHNAETYIPDSGKAKIEGKRGLINEVAKNLAKELEQKGLRANFDDTIHDYPEYNASYTNSKETVKKIIAGDDEIWALFDIHRDSIPGSNSAETIEVSGEKSARILIIVGSDERKPHPHWQENLAFAQKINDQAEKLYPGLIKAVRTKAGTYNQEFHPQALLLEFGNDRNSYAEVAYATKLFADVLVEVLKEE